MQAEDGLARITTASLGGGGYPHSRRPGPGVLEQGHSDPGCKPHRGGGGGRLWIGWFAYKR